MQEVLEQFGFEPILGTGDFKVELGDLRCVYTDYSMQSTHYGVLNSWAKRGYNPFLSVRIHSEKQLAILLEDVL